MEAFMLYISVAVVLVIFSSLVFLLRYAKSSGQHLTCLPYQCKHTVSLRYNNNNNFTLH